MLKKERDLYGNYLVMNKQEKNLYFNKISEHYDVEFYDTILYAVNEVLFNYGDHHKSNSSNRSVLIKRFVINVVSRINLFIACLRKKKSNSKGIILSNAYVTLKFDDKITNLPPWHSSLRSLSFTNFKLNKTINEINKIIKRKSIKLLFSEKFLSLIEDYKHEFSELIKFNNVKCLVVPNDMSFYENLSIKIARKNNVPTFVYLHGLPGRFNLIDENRADYLIVWGKGIKNSYVKAGFLSDKILTIKHPFYSDFQYKELRSNLEDVLVLTKATPGTPSSSNELFLQDRSKSLFYLEKVKELLTSLGVKTARLRLHPSEVDNFYKENLIDDFYVIDKKDKVSSLKNATLVIGPTSTMLLDAIKTGVNYILFDPMYDDQFLDNSKELVEPFDGTSFIKLSLNLSDFRNNIINSSENIDLQKFSEYLEVDQNDLEILSKIIS